MKALCTTILLLIMALINSSKLESSCTSNYRSYDGTCNNEDDPDGGKIGQVFNLIKSTTLGLNKLEPVKNPKQLEDPITEWLKELLDVVLEDVFDIEMSENEAVNSATPYLDLSNIYDPFSGQLLPSTSLFSQLLLSEHSRLLSKINNLGHDWTEKKMFEEARRIVTAKYQNIVVRELMPLLVGRIESESLASIQYNKNVKLAVSAEELVLGHGLAEMFGYQNKGDDMNFEHNFVLRSETGLDIGFGRNLSSLKQLVSLSKRLVIEDFAEVQKSCPWWTFSDGNSLLNPLFDAMQENPKDGGILGPTFSCFLYQLVAKLISGDKFWFLNQFSVKQSLAMKSSSLSTLICKNMKQQDISVQRKALLLPDTSLNAPVPCKTSSDIDLESLLADEDLEMFAEEFAMIDEAVDIAQKEVDWRHVEEVKLFQKNKFAPRTSGRGSPSFGKPTQASLEVAGSSAVLEVATYKLKNMTDSRSKRSHKSIIHSSHARKIIGSKTVNKVVIKKIQSKVRNHNSIQRRPYQHEVVHRPQYYFMHQPSSKLGQIQDELHKCSPQKDNAPCDHTSKYRTFSGRCNNLQSPNYGKSTTVFRRLLPSEYNDGLSSPRSKNVDGRYLPNPRRVSRRIHTTQVTPDPKFTLTMMQWGQFVDHDLVLTPIHRGFNKSILDCKACDSGFDHPACFPILIPDGDSHFPRHQCMAFTRSLPGQQKLGPREQLNQVTHYLDSSMIYGSDNCQAEELRVPDSYLLRMTANPLSHPDRPMKDLLPMTGNNHGCRSTDGQCFLAGDERVNEQPGLTSFHTVLVREHNDVSKELARINPHWTNEKVFQETRRIISAIIQHITYNEFLPRVLGPNSVRRFSLELLETGYYNEYNSKCSAAIFNEFSTAAFRFGHSMIRPNLTMMTEEEMMEGGGDDIPLRDHFNNPDLVRSGRVIDSLIRGLVMAPMEVMDNRVTNEIQNHLFEEKGKKFSGMDLPAINIQRSRDHGIPGYNKYREICGLSRNSSFHFNEIPEAWAKELHAVYHHPDDVDLFPGMLVEIKLNGAAVGPTLACLIGLQFRHLRSCDRFWYESGDPSVRFTVRQLQEIRGETLSGLLCRNCDQPGRLPQSGMDHMQRLTNPMVHCEDMKHMDLSLWREGKDGECEMDGVTWSLSTHTVIQGVLCTCTREGPVCATDDQ